VFKKQVIGAQHFLVLTWYADNCCALCPCGWKPLCLFKRNFCA